MLVEFRVKNFRSFKDEQVFSMVASNDDILSENCVTEGKLQLLKAAGVYGPNASGKSNLVKALGLMQKLVLESANYEPGKKLPVQPFLLDDESSTKSSSFEVVFYHGDIRYQYGFTASRDCIHDEWLLAYPKGRSADKAQKWFHRSFNETSTAWKFSSFLKGERENLKNKTRDNALFLSVAAQWNNKQLTTVYEWFRDKLRVLTMDDVLRPVTASMLADSQEDVNVEDDLKTWISNLLKKADMGIYGVNAKEIKKEELKFPENMPSDTKENILKNLKQNPIFDVKTLHRNVATGKDVYFPMEEESAGTRRFFDLLGPFLETITHDYTAVIDELETSLHPLLTRELVKFIQDSGFKNSSPQLIFTTHDTTLLDPELFRRDQIWFTEKDRGASTQLYSMSDYKEQKPRKGEAMQKGYLAGRYGAIPILEAFNTQNG
ncbi:ATP/GTP-binding protein [Planctomycetota bacterium]